MRWEYKTIILKIKIFANAEANDRAIEEQLNQQGVLGWELVNYVIMGSQYRAIFKREK